MALLNEVFCQIFDRFITKEHWNKHLFSSRYLHIEVTGYWPAYFPQRKITRHEGMKLEKAFWEMIFVTEYCIEMYVFLKTYFRMCLITNNYVPVRLWLDDPDEEGQWGCGYRDDMVAQFKQDFYNKIYTLQNQGKDDEIDTLENRINFWINIISNAQGPVPANLYDHDYNDEGLDSFVRGGNIFPEIGELKKLLDILRCK